MSHTYLSKVHLEWSPPPLGSPAVSAHLRMCEHEEEERSEAHAHHAHVVLSRHSFSQEPARKTQKQIQMDEEAVEIDAAALRVAPEVVKYYLTSEDAAAQIETKTEVKTETEKAKGTETETATEVETETEAEIGVLKKKETKAKTETAEAKLRRRRRKLQLSKSYVYSEKLAECEQELALLTTS